MTTVSIQEMRFEFAKVKRALERGEELLLTFRNRPLARLSPVASQRPKAGETAARSETVKQRANVSRFRG